MKIKILSRSSGTIVSAAFPPEKAVKNVVEAGPMLKRGMSFDEVELPKTANIAEASKILKQSGVKRGKTSNILVALKKRRSAKTASAMKKKR